MFDFLKRFFNKFKQKRKFKKAIKHLNQGNYEQSEELLLNLVNSEFLDLKKVYFNLASALMGSEKFGQAESYLKKAVNKKDDIDFLWGTLGEVYILQEKWQQAEEALNRAIDLNPEKEAYKTKSTIVRGDEETKNDYLKYYSLVKKAINLQKEEKWKQSIKTFKKALEYNDTIGYAYNQIGAIYNNKLNNAEKAVKYFELALEKEPNNKMFKTNLKRAK